MAEPPAKREGTRPKKRYVPPRVEVVELGAQQALLGVCMSPPSTTGGGFCTEPYTTSAVALLVREDDER